MDASSTRKHDPTIVYLVECSGGIAPEPLARLRRNARFAKTKGARDSTNYGLARVSPRSYFTHHTQRISAAAVRADPKKARPDCVPQAERVRGRLSSPPSPASQPSAAQRPV